MKLAVDWIQKKFQNNQKITESILRGDMYWAQKSYRVVKRKCKIILCARFEESSYSGDLEERKSIQEENWERLVHTIVVASIMCSMNRPKIEQNAKS